jgi:hypothetical protein
LPLNNSFLVSQGSFVYLNQITGSIALDISGSSTYSDMILKNGVYYNISSTSNYRFILAAISNFSSYKTNFSVAHSYNKAGLNLISIQFMSSNVNFTNFVSITQCKF